MNAIERRLLKLESGNEAGRAEVEFFRRCLRVATDDEIDRLFLHDLRFLRESGETDAAFLERIEAKLAEPDGAERLAAAAGEQLEATENDPEWRRELLAELARRL